MVGDRERCLAAGMQNYLSKPIDLRELIEVVEETVQDALQARSPRALR
jgi:CheY-like chemotaxis protein